MVTPLEQFEIFWLSNHKLNFFFTNFSLTLFVICGLLIISFYLLTKNPKLIPSRWEIFFENCYSYVLNILVENAGKRSQVYFPLVFLLFTFVLISNIFGMFPFGYAITSQVLITFLLSCTVFLGSIFIGLLKHEVNFFSLFFPSGSPVGLSFLLVPIELLSFISRPFSLGIRLFANMLAGHVLLKIIAGFLFSFLGIAAGSVILDNSFLYTLIEFNYTLLGSKFAKGGFQPEKINFVLFSQNSVNLSYFLPYTTFAALNRAFFIDYFQELSSLVFFGPKSNFLIYWAADYYEGFTVLKLQNGFNFSTICSATDFFQPLALDNINNLQHFAKPCTLGVINLDFSLGYFLGDTFIKVLLTILPVLLLSGFILLELGIAFLQAYVFTILTSIYISDSINLH